MNATPASIVKGINDQKVREAKTPVYTSETPKREHFMAVELEFTEGGRFWDSMPESKVDQYIKDRAGYTYLSDVDHSAMCWCQK